MNKDVIYIDVEDDITSIIGKIKDSKEKIIALVPPKRVGVLQSAVNLRLLARTATQSKKHIALVTNNQSLVALASAAGIPVAKNLQAKPEIATTALAEDAADASEEIIDGAELPVGDHAAQSISDKDQKDARNAAMAAALASAPKDGETPKPKAKNKSKVPNFNTFRKRFVLLGLAALLFLTFVIWAIFFAPRAIVIIKAKTTSTSINQPVTMSSAPTDLSKSNIQAISKTKSSEKTVDFAATGKKDAGKKATGTVTFSTSSFGGLGTIPAGTKLTSSSGLVFLTDSAVTLSYQGGSSASGSTGVTAVENGSKYNAASGSVSGAPSDVNASFDGPTSGGVTKTVKIVTASDIQKAKESLVDEKTDTVREELKKQFSKESRVIEESFRVDYKSVKSTPGVGEEADTAVLNATVTYVLYAVEKSELQSYLDAHLKELLRKEDNRRVYENGVKNANFQEVSDTKNGAKATLIATAQIGPEIKDDEVKAQSKGKRYGEIQQILESIQGVEDVDVKFFPFWVNSAPNDEAKITIEFNIDAKQ